MEQIIEGSIPGIEPSQMEHVMDLIGSKIQHLLCKIRQEKKPREVLEAMTCGMWKCFKRNGRVRVGGHC